MRGHPHGVGAEQDRPDLPVSDRPVSIALDLPPSYIVFLRYDADKLAKECKMKLYRTSVKEDLNVAVVFQHLAENYVNKVGLHFLLTRNADT